MSVKASVKKYSRMRIKITSKIQSIVPWSKDYLLRTFHESSYTHGVIGQDPAIWAFWIILVIDRETDRQNNAREDITVQSSMSGSPVAVRAGVSLLGRWLLPRVRQHSALSAVSWRSDLRGTANTQQLRRQNFCSRWTFRLELFSSPAAQSRHHLWTVQTTAEGTPFFGKHEHGALWLLICGALEKHLRN